MAATFSLVVGLSTDLSEEIQQHLDEKVEDLVAEGMPRERGFHCARRQFGNVALIEEQGREVSLMWGVIPGEEFTLGVEIWSGLVVRSRSSYLA